MSEERFYAVVKISGSERHEESMGPITLEEAAKLDPPPMLIVRCGFGDERKVDLTKEVPSQNIKSNEVGPLIDFITEDYNVARIAEASKRDAATREEIKNGTYKIYPMFNTDISRLRKPFLWAPEVGPECWYNTDGTPWKEPCFTGEFSSGIFCPPIHPDDSKFLSDLKSVVDEFGLEKLQEMFRAMNDKLQLERSTDTKHDS
jgi:hypothetical protein